MRQPAALFLVEETADLANPSVAFYRQPAQTKAPRRTAKSNLRPMPRKLLFCFSVPGTGHEADSRIGNQQRLGVPPPPHAGAQTESQHQHFQGVERQHRPETLECK